METRKIQILATFVLLLAAAVVGWWKLSASASAPACDAECVIREKLSLTDGQAQRVAEIIATHRLEAEAVFAAYEPRMNQSRDNARARLASVLDPAQQKRFEAFLAEMRARRPKLTAKAVLLPHCHGRGAPARHYPANTSAAAERTRKEGRLDRLMRRLALEPEQTEAVRAVLGGLHDEIKPIKRAMKTEIGVLRDRVAAAIEAELDVAQTEAWLRFKADPAKLCNQGGAHGSP